MSKAANWEGADGIASPAGVEASIRLREAGLEQRLTRLRDAARRLLTEVESLGASSHRDTLDALGAEFDTLLARLQTPKSRSAMKAAFNSSPAQLGRAAIKAAKRPPRNSPSLPDVVEQFEVDLIRVALKRAEGSQIRAARLLGIKPTTLAAKIKRYKLSSVDKVTKPDRW